MRAALWNRSVLGVAAAVEAVTGLTLIVVPQVVARLLFGVEVTGVAVVIGRVAGIALLSLGLGCWLGRNEADGASAALSAMLTHDFLVTLYLAFVGLGTEFVGPLLWPAVAAHAVLTALLGRSWIKARQATG
jgi:hypothetical protein